MARRPTISAPAGTLLCAALAMGLAACQQTTPSEALWPNQPLTDFGDPWVPDLFTAENAGEFGDMILIRRSYVDAAAATVIDNLDPDNRITVHYVDQNDSRQAVAIEAGGSLAVAALPRRIVSIRR